MALLTKSSISGEIRQEMTRIKFPVLVFLALAAMVATYNTITMINSYHNRSGHVGPGAGEDDNKFSFESLIKPSEETKRSSPTRLFHVAVTANDFPYNRWQCQIMYYWYKKFKDAPGSEMGGFTRVLHSGKPDNFMEEIPTVVVDPLPDGEDRGYIVLNRPWAFVQWLRKTDIPEEYASCSKMSACIDCIVESED